LFLSLIVGDPSKRLKAVEVSDFLKGTFIEFLRHGDFPGAS